MDNRIIVFFIILSICFIIPSAYAQSINPPSIQKLVEVTIDLNGDVKVKHVIQGLNSPAQINLIAGEKTNLKVVNEDGEEQQFGVLGKNEGVMIFPSREDVIIEYDIEDQIILKDNLWTWDFLYPERTSFIFPDEADLIFVNEKPAYLGEKKGIQCHGCKMLLEYSIGEPKNLERLVINQNEYFMEVWTWAEINNIGFDKNLGSLNFEYNGENEFVTTIIPLDLMDAPFQVFLDDEKIIFHKFLENGTHVALNVRPQNSGEVSIQGIIIPIFEENENPPGQFPIEYIIIILVVGGIIGGVFAIKKR